MIARHPWMIGSVLVTLRVTQALTRSVRSTFGHAGTIPARTWMAALMLGLLIPTFVAAQTPDRRSLAEKQETQKRVRKIAEDVVSSILDVQLQQLEDNRLTSLDIYRDVKEMRQHVSLLVANEMPEVVDLLGKVQGRPPDSASRPCSGPGTRAARSSFSFWPSGRPCSAGCGSPR